MKRQNKLAAYLRSALTAAIPVVALAAGCVDQDESVSEPLGQVSQALVTNCDYLNPALVAPLPVPVDFDRELVIRDLSVVEDPCRTSWTLGAGCGSSRGIWTFGHLMSEMSGKRAAHRFMAEWLNEMVTNNTVNGFVVPGRPQFRTEIIEPWLAASGCSRSAPIVGAGACTLDLQQAPFRLLAVVNRIDLAGPVGGATSDPGEMRFVFGTFNLDTSAVHAATFILEYSLPSSTSTFGWAANFHQLSSLALGSPGYLGQLEVISNQVTLAGAEPGNPNLGSSIGQLRSNEVSFGPGPDWSMREFTLTGAIFDRKTLQPTTTKQTPDNSMMFTPPLVSWFAVDPAAIGALTHVVPASFAGVNLLTGDSIATTTFFWQDAGGSLSALERHRFGFATCNGCHTQETGALFTHIDPRAAGIMSNLSGFLGTSTTPGGGGLPLAQHTVTDPASTATFAYNEPWRRICEATRLLNGDPTPYTNGAGVH